MLFAGGGIAVTLTTALSRGLRFDRREAFDTDAALARLLDLNYEALTGLLPLLGAVVVAVVGSSLLLSGWVLSGEPLVPQASRLNPVAGLARIFSVVGLVELLKSVVKTLFLGAIAVWFALSHLEGWLQLADDDLTNAVVAGLKGVGEGMVWVIGALAVVAAIDVPFQMWNFRKQLRMTKEEVRREMREQEGDPQVKARIRQLQRAAARRRMMANVSKATVVITNPDHYAVALRYESDRMSAPRVLAKGIDLIAQRIREIAGENAIPILEAPPLARALYTHADLEQEIPPALYTAVAEVLAWVYALEQGQGAVAPPVGIAVPAGLDPLEATPAPPASMAAAALGAGGGPPVARGGDIE